MTRLHLRFIAVVLAMLLLVGMTSTGNAATRTWDGNGNVNTGGSWSTANLWSSDLVPVAADTAVLPNVTSGARVITISTSSTITQLQMTQTTTTAAGILTLGTATKDLWITSATPIVQTLGGGVTGTRLTINLTAGSIVCKATGTAMVTNLGALNLSGGGSLKFNQTGTNHLTCTVTNSGTIKMSGGGSGISKLYNDLVVTNNAGAAINVVSGTNMIGTTGTTANTRGDKILNNSGAVAVSNGAQLVLASPQGWENFTINNIAGGTITLGSSTTAGQAILKRGPNPDDQPGTLTLNNYGTFSMYGSSQFLLTVGSQGADKLNNFGTWNMVCDGTGVVVRPQQGSNNVSSPTINNAGLMNIQKHTAAASGIALYGATTGRVITTLNNGTLSSTGTVTGTGYLGVDPATTLIVQSYNYSSSDSSRRAIFNNNAGSIVTIGVGATGGAGIGKLQLNNGGAGTTPAIPQFNNSGTLNILGASVVELSPSASIVGSFDFTNTGYVRINNTSSIGNTTKATNFNNAGTMNKDGNGIAYVYSNASGTAVNTGTLDCSTGSLVFSSPVTSSGTIKGRTYTAPSFTITGTLSPFGSAAKGTMSLTGNVTIGNNGAIDIQLDSGSADLLTIQGNLSLTGTNDSLVLATTNLAPTGTYTIITYTGSLTGTFKNVTGLPAGGSIAYASGAVLLCTTPPASYYVDPAGNDGWPGTSGQPFLTIGKGVATGTAPGSVIEVRSGTYRVTSQISFPVSGTLGNPITLRAAQGATVYVKGSADVSTGWTLDSGSIYKKTGWTYYAGSWAAYLADPVNNWDALSKARNQLFVDGAYVKEVPLKADMVAGSFYVDSAADILYLWMPSGGTPTGHLVECSNFGGPLLTTSAKNYIIVSGLKFMHCTNTAQEWAMVRMNGGTGSNFDKLEISYAAGAGVTITGSNNSMTNCKANYNGQLGIHSSSAVDCLVEDCETSYNNTLANKQFDYGWEGGGNKFSRADGFVVNRHLAHDNVGAGVWFDVSNHNCTISNSVCYGNKWGIHYEISYSGLIYNNLCYSNLLLGEVSSNPVGMGIYISSSALCKVFNNVCWDNDTYGINVNTTIRGDGSDHDVTGSNNLLYNNIISMNQQAATSCKSYAMGYGNDATPPALPVLNNPEYVIDYNDSDFNCFYFNVAGRAFFIGPDGIRESTLAAWQTDTGRDMNSVWGDPLFVNAPSDFSVPSNSPAVNAGVTLNEVPDDFEGTARPQGGDYDIGAYER